MGLVRHVCLSPEGQCLAVASGTRVFLWDVATGQLIIRLDGHGAAVTATCVCRDGRKLISASKDGTARIWDIRTGCCERILQHGSGVSCLHVNERGMVLTGAADGQTRLFDLATGERHLVLQHRSALTEVFLCEEGRRLTAEHRFGVEYWDIAKRELIRFYPVPPPAASGKVSVAAGLTLSTSIGRQAMLIALHSGECQAIFTHDDRINSVYLTRDGALLATGSSDCTARLWSARGACLRTFHHPDDVTSVQISRAHRCLVTGSIDKTAKVWSLRGKLLKTIEGFGTTAVTGAMTPDGGSLIIGGYHGLAVYDLETGLRVRDLTDHEGWLSSASLSPEGRLLATGSKDGTVRLWRPMEQSAAVMTVRAEPHELYAAALDADRKRLYTGSRDGNLGFWSFDAYGVVCERSVKGHSACVRSVAVRQDGQAIATAGVDGKLRLWAPDGTGTRTIPAHAGDIYGVVFHPDGVRLATASLDGTAKLWDQTGQCLGIFSESPAQVRSVSFVGSRRLLTAEFDGAARLWDIETNELLMVYRGGHSDWIRWVSPSPDGTKVITAGRDGRVCFWDLQSGQLLVTLHLFKRGFLWTTPPDTNAPEGWIWTDREDLLEVTEEGTTGSRRGTLAPTDLKRKAYLMAYSNRAEVMRRVAPTPACSQRDLAALIGVHRQLQGATHQTQLLVSSAS